MAGVSRVAPSPVAPWARMSKTPGDWAGRERGAPGCALTPATDANTIPQQTSVRRIIRMVRMALSSPARQLNLTLDRRGRASPTVRVSRRNLQSTPADSLFNWFTPQFSVAAPASERQRLELMKLEPCFSTPVLPGAACRSSGLLSALCFGHRGRHDARIRWWGRNCDNFPLTSRHAKEPAGSVQRRRARHHHHHHGAGVEGAARDRSRRPGTVAPGVFELRVEFPLCRHLLEQPSPHVSFHQIRDRRHPVGKLAPAVLAVAFSVLSVAGG